jgi:sugar O-acyltransferase (sialic acid O-acetyltransferase NeuD family)
MKMDNTKKIAIYGAGGFGKEVACILEKINQIKPTWEFVGFFDDGKERGMEITGFGVVLGDLHTLNQWPENIHICFAVGNPSILKKLVTAIVNPHVIYPNIIHPDAFFAHPKSFKIGKGNVIVRGCSFSCDVEIGDFNQFNSISALAHDVKVGSFNVFMPLTRISGECTIGDCNFFGIGSVVLQGFKIGNNTRIGAGSYVMSNTKDGFLHYGNPARKVDL